MGWEATVSAAQSANPANQIVLDFTASSSSLLIDNAVDRLSVRIERQGLAGRGDGIPIVFRTGIIISASAGRQLSIAFRHAPWGLQCLWIFDRDLGFDCPVFDFPHTRQ